MLTTGWHISWTKLTTWLQNKGNDWLVKTVTMGWTVDEPNDNCNSLILKCSRHIVKSKLASPSNHFFSKTVCLKILNIPSHLTFRSMWQRACFHILEVTYTKTLKLRVMEKGTLQFINVPLWAVPDTVNAKKKLFTFTIFVLLIQM